jgi:uncharacterized damage-inducible protein DinB
MHSEYAMQMKERFRRQLVAARETSERLLADFQTPEDWTRQVHPNCNHAMWFAGHMAQSDNFFISLLAPEKARELPEFGRLFGMGSQPSGNPSDYPPPHEVLAVMRERRAALLEILESLDQADFAKPMPKGTPDFLSDVASVFEMVVWHEGMHSGQLSVARRALGHQPLFSPG